MDLWTRINNVFFVTVLPAFSSILEFFLTPVSELIDFDFPGDRPLIEDAIKSLIESLLSAFEYLGFNTDVAVWEFVLVNAGVILTLWIITSFVRMIFG